jgi:ferric-dicitrate binding protein FerR (iron transport regulator)
VGLFRNGEEYRLENASLLEPGYKATSEKSRKEILFEQVDTEIYTGWVQGKIIFNSMPFKDILKKLERQYNVEIINNNKQLDEEIFTASFDTETIEQVLTAFNKNYPINYQIRNNQIIID